jgi:apolipoprotein N-acyltransferase
VGEKISVIKIVPPRAVRRSMWGCAQYLVHACIQLKPNTLIVTPESCLLFPLNKEPRVLAFIQAALQNGQLLMLAGQYQTFDNRFFQVVYMITAQGVQSIYFKQHAVPCVEQMPRWAKLCPALRTIFKAQQSFVAAARDMQTPGFYWQGRWIVPRLCSDFFLVTTTADLVKLRHRYGENLVVVLHVNDTWFAPYMRALLLTSACMRARSAGVDLLFVGYAGPAHNPEKDIV